MAEALTALRLESNRSDLSKTAKELIAKNTYKITVRLNAIDALLTETVDLSDGENINLSYHERKLIVQSFLVTRAVKVVFRTLFV